VTIDRLRAHYAFTKQPFGRGHQEAVARLRWLIEETAIGVLTGEVGAGKTVAARAATAALDASRHTVVYLANPMVGARGIHHHLVTALGEIPRFHRPALIAQTADLLAAEHDERRKRVVLVVDEAHLLANDQLEQLRLLTNTDMDARSPLTLILLGQPTLKRRLKQGHFAALDQRMLATRRTGRLRGIRMAWTVTRYPAADAAATSSALDGCDATVSLTNDVRAVSSRSRCDWAISAASWDRTIASSPNRASAISSALTNCSLVTAQMVRASVDLPAPLGPTRRCRTGVGPTSQLPGGCSMTFPSASASTQPRPSAANSPGRSRSSIAASICSAQAVRTIAWAGPLISS
jgi:hypothetical protein